MQNYEVIALNADGHGVINTDESEVSFDVPFTLPGERVVVELRHASKKKQWGMIKDLTKTSNQRIKPVCKHFGSCGGCRLQHLSPRSYADFKRQQVVRALQQHGLQDDIVCSVQLLPARTRRRIDFKAQAYDDHFEMGFQVKNSRHRIQLDSCSVIHPDLEACLKPIRSALKAIMQVRECYHIFMLRASNGVTILLAGIKRGLQQKDIKTLKTMVDSCNLAQLQVKIRNSYYCLGGHSQPYIDFAGHKVKAASNVFFQASKDVDELLAKLVIEALSTQSKHVVDLFAGRGTLTLPLAEQGGVTVDAYEGDRHSSAALAAVDHKCIKVITRNLYSNPLTTKELNLYDAAVLDPPRPGALEQVQQLANSQVPVIVYIACNPVTFARDASLLVAKGSDYILQKIVPVDAFMWSHHIELVAVFQHKNYKDMPL